MVVLSNLTLDIPEGTLIECIWNHKGLLDSIVLSADDETWHEWQEERSKSRRSCTSDGEEYDNEEFQATAQTAINEVMDLENQSQDHEYTTKPEYPGAAEEGDIAWQEGEFSVGESSSTTNNKKDNIVNRIVQNIKNEPSGAEQQKLMTRGQKSAAAAVSRGGRKRKTSGSNAMTPTAYQQTPQRRRVAMQTADVSTYASAVTTADNSFAALEQTGLDTQSSWSDSQEPQPGTSHNLAGADPMARYYHHQGGGDGRLLTAAADGGVRGQTTTPRKSATKRGIDPASLYYCNHCGQSFMHLHTMRRHHMTVHVGVRKFHCNGCGKSFGQSFNLKRHQSRHCSGSALGVTTSAPAVVASSSALIAHRQTDATSAIARSVAPPPTSNAAAAMVFANENLPPPDFDPHIDLMLAQS